MITKDDIFIPANHVGGEDTEHASPSGRYTLRIEKYRTVKGGWDFSQGTVTRTSDSQRLARVRRNYPQFPFAWVENHPDGHDYLICGRHYMGQTIIRLDAEDRKAAEIDIMGLRTNGEGFCWANVLPSPDGLVLAVEGCYWGGPYDARFYDFSHPFAPPYAQLAAFECLFEDFRKGWVNNATYELQEDDIWAQGYDDREHDGRKRPQRIRRWRRGTTEEEIEALPRERWLPFPGDEDDDAVVVAEEAGKALASDEQS